MDIARLPTKQMSQLKRAGGQSQARQNACYVQAPRFEFNSLLSYTLLYDVSPMLRDMTRDHCDAIQELGLPAT